MRTLAGFCAALLLSACVASGGAVAPPQTVGQVDLSRYQGTWYELARLPMFFQRNCAQSEAHYALQGDGTVAVRNRCQTLQGEWQEASGQAFAQQAGQTDKLWVRFDNWFSRLFPDLTRGDYWVLYLDDDYRVALVGNPDRQQVVIPRRLTALAHAMFEKPSHMLSLPSPRSLSLPTLCNFRLD